MSGKTALKLIPILLAVFPDISCMGSSTPPRSVTTAPQSTTTTPAATVSFDFDTGLPALAVGQNTPFDQASDGVTAHFTSPSDPAAFSVQSNDTTFLGLSQFFREYLYQNKRSRTNLDISFSRQLNSITLTFATADYHGVGEVEEPTAVKLTAFANSSGTISIGSATARGSFSNNSFPQGTLSFNSGGQPFNRVVIELLVQPRGGTNFFVDNIAVTTASASPR